MTIFVGQLLLFIYWLPSRFQGKLVKIFWGSKGDFSEVNHDGLEFDAQTGHAYSHSNYFLFRKVLRYINVYHLALKDISIIDVGCGKGRLLIEANLCGIPKIGGIELSDKLYEICQKNLSLYHLDKITVIHGNAQEITSELDEYNVYYLFNPFPESVIRNFLQHVIESARRRKCLVYVIYQHPTCLETVIKEGFSHIKEFSLSSPYYCGFWANHIDITNLFSFDGE